VSTPTTPARPTPQDWPIGAALLQFPATLPDGTAVQDAPAAVWRRVLREVRLAGFSHVDLTDSWLRPGDLDADRLDQFVQLLRREELGVSAISTARRSVIDTDPDAALANVAYLERTCQAAATIGTSVVSVGLFQALTPAQQAAEWFWLAPGHTDPDDPATFDLAAQRLRQVGQRAADLGLQMSLEMYEDTYLGTPDSALRLLEAIDLPNVGLNPDIANVVRLHRPIEPWLDQLTKTLPHANFWHVKNYFRDVDPATGSYATAPAPLELGVISYRKAIEIALRSGFTGPFCTEHYGGDGLSVAATNAAYLRKILADTIELLELEADEGGSAQDQAR
jgi:sugar phosphate isomerase/epimerase